MPTIQLNHKPNRRRWLLNRYSQLELLAFLQKLPRPVYIVTRLRLDAALYNPAPEQLAKQMGRPHKVGKRLPTLKSILEEPNPDWQSLTIEGWYGRCAYPVGVVSQTAVWHHIL